LGQVGGFLQILRFPQTNKTDRDDISEKLIVESGVKHYKPKPNQTKVHEQ
jgi:hypothetical protein